MFPPQCPRSPAGGRKGRPYAKNQRPLLVGRALRRHRLCRGRCSHRPTGGAVMLCRPRVRKHTFLLNPSKTVTVRSLSGDARINHGRCFPPPPPPPPIGPSLWRPAPPPQATPCVAIQLDHPVSVAADARIGRRAGFHAATPAFASNAATSTHRTIRSVQRPMLASADGRAAPTLRRRRSQANAAREPIGPSGLCSGRCSHRPTGLAHTPRASVFKPTPP